MEKPLVSHIGIAVSDLESAIEKFSRITGVTSPEIHTVEDQKVKVAMFGPAESEASGSTRIELVAPTSADSPVAGFLALRGEGLHHICLYVDDLQARLTELKKAGLKLIDETPRTGADGCLIAFVHPSAAGVLIELQQRTK
ncbi:MAG: methylmalonyl-CoA epimerase [Candidatus Zixiibacteriota bacterium]|nr:MAG: methylmalonyl-CoA epimerase [candidate division Zixibacteria bacterium]